MSRPQIWQRTTDLDVKESEVTLPLIMETMGEDELVHIENNFTTCKDWMKLTYLSTYLSEDGYHQPYETKREFFRLFWAT